MTPTLTTDPSDITTSEVASGAASVPRLDTDINQIGRIGIELEYPIADNADNAPATRARNSGDLRRHPNYSTFVDLGVVGGGHPGSDHVGAEIGSPILDLHSEQPEQWYVRAIRQAIDLGFPFAACGYGDTVFGLHFHIDSLDTDEWHALSEMMCEDWSRAFFCASVRPDNASPWRGSGVGSPCFRDESYTPGHADHRGPDGHYEFRLPEPGLPDHVSMMFHFFRLMEHDGPEAARQYARSRVEERDPRLTGIQQFRAFEERYDDFPERAVQNLSGRSSDEEYARHFAEEIMGRDLDL